MRRAEAPFLELLCVLVLGTCLFVGIWYFAEEGGKDAFSGPPMVEVPRPKVPYKDPGERPPFYYPRDRFAYDYITKPQVDEWNRNVDRINSLPAIKAPRPELGLGIAHLLLAIWLTGKLSRLILRFGLIRGWFGPVQLKSRCTR